MIFLKEKDNLFACSCKKKYSISFRTACMVSKDREKNKRFKGGISLLYQKNTAEISISNQVPNKPLFNETNTNNHRLHLWMVDLSMEPDRLQFVGYTILNGMTFLVWYIEEAN
jgi:hypothetical protein